jgi:hypothetical protein
LVGPLPSVGSMKVLDAVVGVGHDALFVSGEIGVFNVGDAPLWRGGAARVSVGVFTGVGDDGSVYGVDDEV